MRKKEEIDTTNSSRVYKMLRKEYIVSCSFCPYHRCENHTNKDDKNWKNYRKNQWKEERYEN